MKTGKLCAVIINEDILAIGKAEPLVDMFEVRIDLIGRGWQKIARGLNKPWIATNRPLKEGGSWRGDETSRQKELLKALELGADIIDIELAAYNLNELVPVIKKKAQCIISSHNLVETPPVDNLKEIVKKQKAAGADICKVVTTATGFEDNLTTLKLIKAFPGEKIISFVMGKEGIISRILCPLGGGFLTYVSADKGIESAHGQLSASELSGLYEVFIND